MPPNAVADDSLDSAVNRISGVAHHTLGGVAINVSSLIAFGNQTELRRLAKLTAADRGLFLAKGQELEQSAETRALDRSSQWLSCSISRN